MGAECQTCDDVGSVSEVETKKVSLIVDPKSPKRKKKRANQEEEMPMMNSVMFSRIDKKSFLSSASKKSKLTFENCKILKENGEKIFMKTSIPGDAPHKLC